MSTDVNRAELADFERFAALPPARLRAEQPGLYAAVTAAADARLRAVLRSQLADAPESVQRLVDTLDLAPESEDASQASSQARQRLLDAIAAAELPDDVADDARARIAQVTLPALVRDDMPLEAQAVGAELRERAVLQRLGQLAGLEADGVQALVGRGMRLAALDDSTLTGHIRAGDLSEGMAAALGLVASVYQLADQNVNVASAVQSMRFAALGNKPPSSLGELAVLDDADWVRVLEQAGTQPAEGETLAAYATRLRRRVAAASPSDSVLRRAAGALDPALLSRVLASNPGVDLLALDYTPGSADRRELSLDAIDETNRDHVVQTLKAFQRVHALSGDPDVTLQLLRAGLDCATSIARLGVDALRERTGMDAPRALHVTNVSRAVLRTGSTLLGTIVDLEVGGSAWARVANTGPDVADYLRSIDGFAQLFGTEANCRCEHCQSILSPAAYFVDLMHFVEEHVLIPVFADKPRHVLHLRVRRPDLWTLPLTCENTETLIATLQIVNEVLENYLARPLGYTGDLGDRAAVERAVYEAALSHALDSFRQPFVLPLEQLKQYLTYFQRSRAEVAETLGAASLIAASARLDLSRSERDVITRPNTRLPFLRRIYGIDFRVPGLGVQPFDAYGLLEPMGLSRDELEQVVETRFVNRQRAISIRAERRDPTSVQNDIERIHGLTPAALDRMHRFVRLWRHVPWTIPELDLVLGRLPRAVTGGITAASLEHLSMVLASQQRFGVAVEEHAALWSDLPVTAVPGFAEQLFDRLFNLAAFVALDGRLPKPLTRFLHPAFRPSTFNVPSADTTLHRLRAGLRLGDEDLALLIDALRQPLAAGADGFLLSVANLSLLYRHARLAERLRLSIAELFQALALAGGQPFVTSLADLTRIVEFVDWSRDSGYSLDDLAFVTRAAPIRNPAAYSDPASLAVALTSAVRTDHALEFADTVFAFLPDVTETISRAVVAENLKAPARFVDVGNGAYRLADDFDPRAASSSLAVPPDAGTFPEAQARDALLAYHPRQVTLVYLARVLGVPAGKVKALVELKGIDLADPSIARALRGETPAGLRDPVADVIERLLPLTVLLRSEVFDALAVAFVGEQAAMFALSGGADPNLSSVRRISAYQALVVAAHASDRQSTQAIDWVNQALRSFDGAGQFTDHAAVARALATEAAVIGGLAAHVQLAPAAPLALQRLARCVALARYFGIDGRALATLVADEYASLAEARDAILAAFRATFPEEQRWQDAIAPFDDRVRERKRDALVDFLIHSARARRATARPNDPIRAINPDFRNANDLYDYFLIDVGVDGPVRTSRVVSAISSVQLYVQRCLLNLEQDQRDVFDREHVAIDPASIPIDEWEWRRLYRLWEANRKIFLWPENYLEPELRDDKTPLFVELESTLLQQEVNEDTVKDALGSYLAGFDQLGRLQIAGAYHDRSGTPDVLHLFGVVPVDPPEHYYRTVENAYNGARTDGSTADRPGLVWSPWRKVDVQIPVRNVAPIVFGGRLYVFWVQLTTAPRNEVRAGSSQFAGYQHRLALSCTSLRLDGSWTPPQSVALANDFPFSGAGVILDPLIDQLELSGMVGALMALLRDRDQARSFARALVDVTDEEFRAFLQALRAAGPAHDTLDPLIEALRRYRRSFGGADTSRAATDRNAAAERIASLSGQGGRTGLTLHNALVDALQSGGIPDSMMRYVRARPTTNAWLARFQIPRFDTRPHQEAREGYTLRQPFWREVYPSLASDGDLQLTAAAVQYMARIDFYERATRSGFVTIPFRFDRCLISQSEKTDSPRLVSFTPPPFPFFPPLPTDFGARPIQYLDEFSFCSLVIERERLQGYASIQSDPDLEVWLDGLLSPRPLAEVPSRSRFLVVNGSVEDAIIDVQGDAILVQGSVRPAPAYLVQRLGTTLGERLIRILFSGGVDDLLALETQRNLIEPALPLTAVDSAVEEVNYGEGGVFRGPLGVYYREIFLHIPFLIANYLNGNARYDVAQRWYQHLFDPTAREHISLALSPDDRARAQRDRVWRFREFRNLDSLQLRELLTDNAALAAYEHNPFNPFAIARLRLSAFQKSVVMKYIDNLLDWGDDLFARFTTESVNEATLLYVLAAEILGERPPELGECGEDAVTPRTYERIAPTLGAGDAILIELETYVLARGNGHGRVLPGAPRYAIDRSRALSLARAPAQVQPDTGKGVFQGYDWSGSLRGAWTGGAVRRRQSRGAATLVDFGGRFSADFGLSLVRQIGPAFCVPRNEELLAYWDRVEDRLFKIRNGLDISGVRRDLALFAPEIDPRLLVRAKALGVSIEEVLDATTGDLPPYRFSYLIERARASAATVQAFGGALLSALEKKDAEDLNQLRAVQQQHLLRLSRQMRQWEIDAAQESVAALEAQRELAEYRRGFYQQLLDEGLSGNETAQQVSRHIASTIVPIAVLLDTGAAAFALITQVGSPFAITWGGIQLTSSWDHYARVARDAAQLAEAVAASAGLEAGFSRRDEGWKHQRDLATRELTQLRHQIEVARLRLEIANDSIKVHDRSIAQAEEMYQFFVDKFSSLGLYTWLSRTLQRCYRDAYTSAYAMARLAEQAYRFERGEEAAPFLQGGYWDSSRAGLLAGERLAIDLQQLERRFIETNYRELEIDQALSLSQINPLAMLRLRQEATCEFKIDELFFDLFYPGQFRRRIKSVRLTIPCVTGPYTNVSATLTLLSSEIRTQAKTGADYLKPVPRRRSTTVATSTAQNDAGVFELSFREERYAPFEGAGAVSTWRLSLPSTFRQFDYDTINDVILHVSYTAEHDDAFRILVEDQNQSAEESLLARLRATTLRRVLSLRQDFSSAFNRLLHSAPTTPVPIDLSDKFFPIFLRRRLAGAERALLVLRAPSGQSLDALAISIDGEELSTFGVDADVAGLRTAPINVAFAGRMVGQHTLSIARPGTLAPNTLSPGGPAIDPAKLDDILIYLEYRVG